MKIPAFVRDMNRKQRKMLQSILFASALYVLAMLIPARNVLRLVLFLLPYGNRMTKCDTPVGCHGIPAQKLVCHNTVTIPVRVTKSRRLFFPGNRKDFFIDNVYANSL